MQRLDEGVDTFMPLMTVTDSSRQHKSRRYIWQGVMLLTFGSALLLCCKLSVSPWIHSALLFSGGGSILLGNGYMLYGLLHHADARVYKGEHDGDANATPTSVVTLSATPVVTLSATPVVTPVATPLTTEAHPPFKTMPTPPRTRRECE